MVQYSEDPDKIVYELFNCFVILIGEKIRPKTEK